MKPIFLAAITASALAANPVLAQDDASAAPGVNFLTNWDADGDGTIALDELITRRADIFSAFDENEDGALSAEEFGVYDRTRRDSMQRPEDRGNGPGRAEQVLGLSASDTDGNGSVSLEEFLAASAVWIGVMDRNGDDVLTVDDFGAGGRQGVGSGRGQGHERGAGQGQGQGKGKGKGKGQGQGQGQGMGRHAQMPDTPYAQKGRDAASGNGRTQGGNRHQGMAPDQRQRMERGQGGAQGHGQQGGQGKGRSQQAVAFQAFATADGALWIVDERTGDVLMCKAIPDTNTAAGLRPVCIEAAIQPPASGTTAQPPTRGRDL
ncbi:EF hand domain-containing protein [Aliiruegeria haliotis]|uniref:EF hand domain-containing protein n=1 Tax=Aliiruegeria haliotis TaxID=1280846 RepID=A0A2T0RN81_9RHOB|nr:EF-hand domain-containing protein [Aliiruegeria haliotis]PRY22582.1 EF hand domain-containing protein [Aliiruegeria haliotis]